MVDRSQTPVEGICIDVWHEWTEYGRQAPGLLKAYTRTDYRGKFAFSVSKPSDDPGGRFTIRFRDCRRESTLAFEWFDNAADVSDARYVRLDDAPVLDAVLDPGGSLSGSVTDRDGSVAGFCVEIWDGTLQGNWPDGTMWAPYARVRTDASGRFHFGGLNSKDYRVAFQGGVNSWPYSFGSWASCLIGEGHLSRWWGGPERDGPVAPDSDVAEQRWPDDAEPITITGGQHVRRLGVVMTQRGAIRGTGSPIPLDCAESKQSEHSSGHSKFRVAAFLQDASDSSADGGDYLNCSGHWHIGGLMPGQYKIRFRWDDNEFQQEWYDDQHDESSAKIVRVQQGEIVSGISARLQRGS